MSNVYIRDNIENAPVRITVFLGRRLFEEASEAAKIVGRGSVENLIVFLLENFVEELKAEGCDIRPFWERVVANE